jgi:hypothetical protein
VAVLILFSIDKSAARAYFDAQTEDTVAHKSTVQLFPNLGLEVHKINRMALAVTNCGFFGTGYWISNPIDPETGYLAQSCEYPIHSDVQYLSVAGLWLGAIVGRDTLVSTGAGGSWRLIEFWPDEGDRGKIIRRSMQPFSLYHSIDAVSEEDIIAVYTDTFTDPSLVRIDPWDNRPHQPLNVEVTQSSYAWSYPYAEDFVLFDFKVRNLGRFPLQKIYMGFMVDADIYHSTKGFGFDSYEDDICGFQDIIPSPIWPGYEDSIMVAWSADNDGDPFGNVFNYTSSPSVTAMRVIDTPADRLEYSFNWWAASWSGNRDWGPRQVTDEKPYRSFGSRLGTPTGDRNKYYMMSTREFDYDQYETAVSHISESWLPPPPDAEDYADGEDTRYLISFGPFELEPGEVLPVAVAYIAGEKFHNDPRAFLRRFDPFNPYPFKRQLDFSDLGLNSLWADWIYDNPGYDTDGDGDSGLARWYYHPNGIDSTYAYYKGDGVPDFRGAAPPPSPKLRVIPGFGKLTLRWNGEVSENFVDVFSGYKDFEGYKVYYGEDNRYSDFVLLCSYDRHDYNVVVWDGMMRRWETLEIPLSYDSLMTLYGPGFDPKLYNTEYNPIYQKTAINPSGAPAYFKPQYWNQSYLRNPLEIHKPYPQANLEDSSDTTKDGFHRFYEYEYILDDLSPTKPLYVSVTSFDYGSRMHRLSALESSLLENAIRAWPLASNEEVESEGLEVIVYPNPYRIDGGYARVGYENRDRTRSAERTRAVHFANLPRICTIRIYTLTGDLVKEIKHFRPDAGPDSQLETWNMLSRNTQVVTTGIYLWSVTSEMGEQLGKLVIIK